MNLKKVLYGFFFITSVMFITACGLFEEKQEETLDLLHNLSSTLRYELYER